ncbi:MAG: serine/threonine protein kinase [Anaerolineae bacterium]|nr:serine/threonine protein kinase [Anaerolineae bacterium]
MLETGSVAQERYRIVKLLGQGGMGSVYRAWDLRLKVPVALKELLPQPGLDAAMLAELRAQFEQEAGVLARLNHPNLVRVTDFFEENDRDYLVMDFVEGRSLADVVIREGAQPESKVLDWGRQLLGALDYCHTHGVVHRDIKPQNIILKSDGTVMLVDFGLVKLWDPNDPRTRTAMRGMGTPEYAPPEQYGAAKDHTGPASDVYSLGATLYHLLTGQAPPTATERMAMPEQFVPLRRLAPAVSPRAESLVMKALALSVSERWQTARQMLEVLVSGPLPAPDLAQLPQTRMAPAPQSGAPQSAGVRAMQTTRAPQTGGGFPSGQTPRSEGRGAMLGPSPAGSGGPAAMQSGTEAGSGMPLSRPVAGRRKGYWVGIVGAALLCIALTCGGYIIGRPIIEGMRSPTETPFGSGTPDSARPTSTEQSVPSSPTSPPEEAATATAKPDADPLLVDQFSVTLANESPYEVCFVYISPADADSWGDDWLASDETIPSGQEREFVVAQGSYDLLARACDRAILTSAWKFDTAQYVVISAPGLVPLRMTNDIGQDICYVFVSLESSDTWGDDRMGSHEVLGVDETRVFFIEPGTIDLMVQDCEGTTVAEQYGIDAQGETFWSISEGTVAP